MTCTRNDSVSQTQKILIPSIVNYILQWNWHFQIMLILFSKSDRMKLELICLHVVKRPNVEEMTHQ